jgi:redox-sensitive bicupin YhaK (pirin superfamily)
MFTLRPSAERGHFNHGWLDTYHSFSFAGYRDPRHMGFRSLRVINEDVVAPGQGFGTHPHNDMEILTYVISGELEHRDSLGSGGIIRPGQWQRMSAGTGIEHSEFNPSAETPVHLLQIWLRPDRKGHAPRYEERQTSQLAPDRWQLVASPDGRDGSMSIHQDALLSHAKMSAGSELAYEFAPGRAGWLQLISGEVRLGEETLRAGDGVAIEDEPVLPLKAIQPAEMLLFDL